MGLLDGVFGGVVGAVVTDVIRRNGGVQGVVNQFETQGFGPTVRSWVSTGPNQPIAPEHVEQVLGDVPPAARCRCREERAKNPGAAGATGPRSWLRGLLGR